LSKWFRTIPALFNVGAKTPGLTFDETEINEWATELAASDRLPEALKFPFQPGALQISMGGCASGKHILAANDLAAATSEFQMQFQWNLANPQH